jgi:hypothetical protein
LQPCPSHRFGIAAQDDIRPASGHVGSDRHRAQPSGLRDDLGLAFVVLGVEDLVLDASPIEQRRQAFALLDRHGADQDRPSLALDVFDLRARDRLFAPRLLALKLERILGLFQQRPMHLVSVRQLQHIPAIQLLDFLGDRREFLPLAAVDHVGVLQTPHRPVGGDGDNFQLVDFPELVGLGHRRAGHPGNLLVQLEEILQRDRRQGLRLLLDLDAFLGLDRLMQSVAPLAPFHQTACEFVDDHHAAFLDHVPHVPLVQMMGLQRVVQQVRPFHVARRIETLHARQPFRLADTLVRQMRGVVFFIDDEMRVAFQLARNAIRLGVLPHIIVCRTRDDQRRSRFIDQDVVDLVHDRIVQSALRLLVLLRVTVVASGRRTHVVAEIIETKLVIGPVGNVASVGLLTLQDRHVALDGPDSQPQPHVQRSHPFHVASSQVIVDRHHVHSFAFECIEVGCQRRDQRLALARHHLGDRAAMQHDPADQLHVVMPHVQKPAASLAAYRERFDQQVVQRFASSQTLTKSRRLLTQLDVAHRLILRFQLVDRLDPRMQSLDITGIRRAEN